MDLCLTQHLCIINTFRVGPVFNTTLVHHQHLCTTTTSHHHLSTFKVVQFLKMCRYKQLLLKIGGILSGYWLYFGNACSSWVMLVHTLTCGQRMYFHHIVANKDSPASMRIIHEMMSKNVWGRLYIKVVGSIARIRLLARLCGILLGYLDLLGY